jgi:hypothetical protein
VTVGLGPVGLLPQAVRVPAQQRPPPVSFEEHAKGLISAPGSVWFEDIVGTCLGTWLAPRYGGGSLCRWPGW